MAWWEARPRVVVLYDPRRPARLLREGPDISEVLWEDTGREQNISNTQLEKEDKVVMSLTTNTRGSTQMPKTKDYSEMTSQELVAEHNRLSDKKVKRFANRAVALRRVRALAGGGAKKPAAAVSGISAEFGCRPGTNREKLLLSLSRRMRRQVPLSELVRSVYGTKSAGENRGALMMVMKGLIIMTKRVPYKVVREKKDGGEVSFGLHPKK